MSFKKSNCMIFFRSIYWSLYFGIQFWLSKFIRFFSRKIKFSSLSAARFGIYFVSNYLIFLWIFTLPFLYEFSLLIRQFMVTIKYHHSVIILRDFTLVLDKKLHDINIGFNRSQFSIWNLCLGFSFNIS